MDSDYSGSLNQGIISHDQSSGTLPLQLLEEITDGFSDERILGTGAFGVVYKGVQKNGEMIAVKKLKSFLDSSQKQFENEVYHLMELKHRNIVQLVGYCYETRHVCLPYNGKFIFAEKIERLLCLEFMPNRSLDAYISDADDSSGLDWHTRYKIIDGICDGLNYLHKKTDKPIIHLDLKPANILLDHYLVPKISDFGLSRLFDQQQTVYTTNCLGTLGYMAPEMFKGKISPKSDIFSLGVIIIEVITGKRDYVDVDASSSEEFVERELKKWRNKLEKAPECTNLEIDCQQIKRCIQIGLTCVKDDWNRRPTTNEIINMLRGSESMDCYLHNGFHRRHHSGTSNRGPDDVEDDDDLAINDAQPLELAHFPLNNSSDEEEVTGGEAWLEQCYVLHKIPEDMDLVRWFHPGDDEAVPDIPVLSDTASKAWDYFMHNLLHSRLAGTKFAHNPMLSDTSSDGWSSSVANHAQDFRWGELYTSPWWCRCPLLNCTFFPLDTAPSSGSSCPTLLYGAVRPWSSFEDQALVFLVHDMGHNWELVSDAINSIVQFKSVHRQPNECKERHKVLVDRSSGDGADCAEDSGSSQHYHNLLPGIPKGSARQLFERLQGPFEEENLKEHFEKIILMQRVHSRRRQGNNEELKPIMQPHDSHVMALSQTCVNNLPWSSLTPLDLCGAISPNLDPITPGSVYLGSHTNGLSLPNCQCSAGPAKYVFSFVADPPHGSRPVGSVSNFLVLSDVEEDSDVESCNSPINLDMTRLASVHGCNSRSC